MAQPLPVILCLDHQNSDAFRALLSRRGGNSEVFEDVDTLGNDLLRSILTETHVSTRVPAISLPISDTGQGELGDAAFLDAT